MQRDSGEAARTITTTSTEGGEERGRGETGGFFLGLYTTSLG